MKKSCHWVDLPQENCRDILGISGGAVSRLNQLVRAYHEIKKDSEKTLVKRIDALQGIVDYLQDWLYYKLKAKDKAKHLRFMLAIAENKKNYLEKLKKIYEKRLHTDAALKEYHEDTSRLVDPTKQAVTLTNVSWFSLKQRHYWGDFWMDSLDPCHRVLTPFYNQWKELVKEGVVLPEFHLWLETQHLPHYIPYVKYFDDIDRQKARLHICAGRAALVEGEAPILIDHAKKLPRMIFVIDLDKEIYVDLERETPYGKIQHSSFVRGKPVLGAGVIQFSEGVVTMVGLESGHYLPSTEIGYQILDIFREKGIELANPLVLEFFHDRNKYQAYLSLSNFFSKSMMLDTLKKAMDAKYKKVVKGNPFEDPKKYRKRILEKDLVRFDSQQYSGKSLVCVFFTRFCGVGCPFCFFKSAPAPGKLSVEGHFSDEGISKFIRFVNAANLGYLLISGGGEPLNHKKAVLQTIEKVNADRIVLVTSGSWAMSKNAGEKYLEEILQAMQKRAKPCYVTVRVSVSEGHSVKLGIKPAVHLLELFESKLYDHPYLKLQLHGFDNDKTVDKIVAHFAGSTYESAPDKRASDDPSLIKIIPKKMYLSLKSGYKIIVGISKVFTSGLRPDLNQPEALQQAISIFERDLIESEDNNSAVIENIGSRPGLDWAVNYNGNVSTWQNQVNDNMQNIYEDGYDKVLYETMRDPITLSYIQKGRLYRERIVEEVSPRSVLRTKAISLRDYSGAVIFDEEKVCLYYAIRALQDYYREGLVHQAVLSSLPDELKELIRGSQQMVEQAFASARYTIFDQYRRKPFNATEWRDLFELVKLGHYDVDDKDLHNALEHYNSQPGVKEIFSLKDLQHETGDVERRLTERFMAIKPMDIDRHIEEDTAGPSLDSRALKQVEM